MRFAKWWIACAVIVAAIVVIVATRTGDGESSSADESPVRQKAAAPADGPLAPADEHDSTTPSPDTETHAAVSHEAAEETGDDAVFRVDAAGELVVDQQTRLNIEALVALTDQRALYDAVREHTEQLPPRAASQAAELVDTFIHYQQAQRQAYRPDDAPLTPEDAIRQLEGLHALREAHFGPEVARRFYGEEESIAREMIEVMRIENDQSLTVEEKQERARALREILPGVAAIEKSNRESTSDSEARNSD